MIGKIILMILVLALFLGVIIYCAREKYSLNCECEKFDVIKKANDLKRAKETFLTSDFAKLDSNGNLIGPRIFTDGYTSPQTFNSLAKAISNNEILPTNGAIGATKGDNFDLQYQSWKETQELENDPTKVKSMEEIDEISKRISSNMGNSSSCMLSRGGSSKAKIILDPLGTAGVMDEYKTPERDRNHKIRMVSYAVPVQGFDFDTNRISDELMSKGNWSKDFSPQNDGKIALADTNGIVINDTNDEKIAETFTLMY